MVVGTSCDQVSCCLLLAISCTCISETDASSLEQVVGEEGAVGCAMHVCVTATLSIYHCKQTSLMSL